MAVKKIPRAFQVGPAAGAQKSVGTDFGEAAGEYVLEKSCKEGVHGERDTPRFT